MNNLRTDTTGPMTSSEPFSGPLNGVKVFYLEDDVLFAESLKLFLDALSCDVTISDNYDNALSRLSEPHINPTLILSDYHLNETRTGLDFLDAARVVVSQPAKGVILTSDHSWVLEQLVMRCGYSFVTKPIHPDTFISLLTNLVLKSR